LKRRIYACSGVFISHLKGTEPESHACTDILEAAREGSIELHTSWVTITEVIALDRARLRRTPDHQRIVTELMDSAYIVYSAVDQIVAEKSRTISWDFQIKTHDALHLATAIVRKCEVVYTIDGPLTSRSGQSSNNIQLPKILLPEFIREPSLPLGEPRTTPLTRKPI